MLAVTMYVSLKISVNFTFPANSCSFTLNVTLLSNSPHIPGFVGLIFGLLQTLGWLFKLRSRLHLTLVVGGM